MTLSSWLLSIAGISVLSVLIDVILPSGQTNKYIKGIFAFCMVFVIISPIPNFLNKEFNLDTIFTSSVIDIKEDFIYQVNRTKLSYLEKQISNEFENNMLKGVNIVVNGDIFEIEMQIKNVYVDLADLVINENTQHIDIRKTAKEIVLKYVDIKEEKIIFNEWKQKMVW